MEKKNVSVLGFGDNVVDLYEHSHIMYPGGNCVNMCAYSSMQNVTRSAYMGYFGNDDIAEFVIGVLKELNIEMVKCKQLEGENGWSKCTLIDGDRTFGDYNQGGVRGKTPYVLDRFDIEYMKQFDFVHTGNYCYTESQLAKMKEAGLKVSFDFSDDSTKEYYESYAPYVTYAFCSFDGTDEEAKEHLKFIHSLGPDIASLTRGAKGCMLYDGNEFFIQPSTPIKKQVDTMGAGDSFITTFMVNYTDLTKQGKSRHDAIAGALQAAADFASKICEIDGAFGHGVPYED